jgi:hypothetical protein
MNVIREINRINKREVSLNVSEGASWHAKYKDSAYIYVGGLPFDLNEGDVIQAFSQYVIDCYNTQYAIHNITLVTHFTHHTRTYTHTHAHAHAP